MSLARVRAATIAPAAAEELQSPFSGEQFRLASDTRTEGLRLLRRHVQRELEEGGSLAAMARRLRVSPQRLHGVYLGVSRPDADLIARCTIVIGIAGHTWGLSEAET